MHDLSVTLVAVATPPGRGGIGCVRISGPAAVLASAAVDGNTVMPAPEATIWRMVSSELPSSAC